MRSLDFAPLSRSTIGFDRMMQLFENAAHLVDEADTSYPPYNIEKLSEDSYRITMAVAGFGSEDLTITQQANALIVIGRKRPDGKVEYLHRGLPTQSFERHFDLADFIKVTAANLVNGLLSIDLAREVPEAMKPRSIKIEGAPSASLRTVEGKEQRRTAERG